MHKILISLVASAAMLFFVSCTGRTATFLAPLSSQLVVVGASNISVSVINYTNTAFAYSTWTATGTVVVRDTVGDVGFSLIPGAITIERKTQKLNSDWGAYFFFTANPANRTNIAKAQANTNDKITLNYSQTTYNSGTDGTTSTNTAALTYSYRGSYSLTGYSAGGTAMGGSDIVITGQEGMWYVPATISVSYALTN